MNKPKELSELRASVEKIFEQYKENQKKRAEAKITKVSLPDAPKSKFRTSSPIPIVHTSKSDAPDTLGYPAVDTVQSDPNIQNENEDSVDQDDLDELCDTLCQHIDNVANMLFQAINYTHQRINNTEDGFYKYTDDHSQGHLPSIKGAEKMQNALKVLNIDGDYDVVKPKITSANSQFGFDVKLI